MPVKFKIYYCCALGILLWGVGIVGIMVYQAILYRFFNTTGITAVFFPILIAVYITKGILSLRAIQQFKHTTMPGKKEKAFFIIFFVISIALSLLTLVACIFIIVEELNDSSTITQIETNYILKAIIGGYFVLCPCTVYITIFDLILAKAITEKYYDSLHDMDFETQEQV